MSATRMEAIGSLLTAMAVVALTGDMPDFFSQHVDSPTFDIQAKPKIVVPLSRRFSGLYRYSANGWFRGHAAPFSPSRFLEQRFGLSWAPYYTRDLLHTHVMPSTIQIEIARHMAGGDPDLTEKLLSSRGSKGINAATDAVSRRFAGIGCIAPALWRYAGNADELWFALRDEMEQAVRSISGGAA